MFAPVVVFLYSRLEHTKELLESINEDYLAMQSELFIFCDGPKYKSEKKK